MKLNHILEAELASTQKAPDSLITKPRLQREGDFVWHLYKFFEPNQDDSQTQSRQNPDHKKEVAKVLAGVINDFKKRFPKNKELQKIQTYQAATKMATASRYQDPTDFEPWPYDPDDGYDDEGEYNREVEEERREHEESSGWSVNSWRGMGDGFKKHQGHGGHKPTIEKLLQSISREGKKRLESIHKRLPRSHNPTATVVWYKPKDGIRVFANKHHVNEIKVRMNTKGVITSAAFVVGTGDTEKQLVIKGMTEKSPAEVREIMKYYKEHSDW